MNDNHKIPAFPTGDHPESRLYANPGMSLRDYFAAKALQGLCSDPSTEGTPVMEMAAHCYGISDAMLAARSA
jgi:hypothetical protein